MNELRTRRVEKHRATAYIRKAGSFHSGISLALDEGEWNRAALLAVHCVISSCDAVTTHYLGERSAGERHEDVVELLRRTSAEGVAEKCRQVLNVLQLKSLVEYSPDEPTGTQAREMAKTAQRVYAWAKALVRPDAA